ncbi:hypothetical protein [Sorangium sp. So ce1078]|uniref:hypothetical protein n=1 Tax=Sorangium sp. So ce1078 TaxID=3133329 RepID=UPI003F5EB885
MKATGRYARSVVSIAVFTCLLPAGCIDAAPGPVREGDEQGESALEVALDATHEDAALSALSSELDCDRPSSVALVVDQAFHGPLQVELARLADDIRRELDVCVVTELVDTTVATAKQVQSRLKTLRQQAGLVGNILVGDIPSVFLGDLTVGGVDYTYLTDAFYEVLDDQYWQDRNRNGIYDRQADIVAGPEKDVSLDTFTVDRRRHVWSGRLKPPAVLPLADRVAQLRAYLDRNHAYRTGAKSYGARVVYFDSLAQNGDPSDGELTQAQYEQQAQSFYAAGWLFTQPAADRLSTVWSPDLTTQRQLWLDRLSETSQYAFVSVHGSSASQWLGGSMYLDGRDYQARPPRSLFLDLQSCSNGYFWDPDYLGGWLLFSGEVLAIRAFTSPVFIVGDPVPSAQLQTLAHGLTLGEARLGTAPIDIDVLLGDPTLRLRPRATGGSTVTVSEPELVFPPISTPSVTIPHVAERFITLTNSGSAPIKLFRMPEQEVSWGGLGAVIEPSFMVDPADLVTFPISLAPGQSRQLRVYFTADAPPYAGDYRWEAVFYTDSPSQPFVSFRASRTLY